MSKTLQSILQSTSLEKVDAKVLLAYLVKKHFNWPKSYLISHDQDPLALNSPFLIEWEKIEAQRIQGIPVAYLTQTKGFHGVELKVTPDVLIPRPETELLVEYGLQWVRQHLVGDHLPLSILDLGCGSGAIILALAKALQSEFGSLENLHFHASDISQKALLLAKENAHHLALDAFVTFYESDWFAHIPNQPFHLILSNPPYICAGDSHLLQGDLRFEPNIALTDQSDGLGAYRKILSQINHYLIEGGTIALEHGFDQHLAIQSFMKNLGLHQIDTQNDFSNLPRITFGKR